MSQVNILCIKWGKKYGPDYVNKLYNMVSRNLTLPFRFICLTDDAAGIDATKVEVKDIPKVGFADFDNREPWSFGHGWLKVTSFADPLYDITGPTLFIDLDVVIVGNIDCFFEPEGEFRVIKEWEVIDSAGFSLPNPELEYINDQPYNPYFGPLAPYQNVRAKNNTTINRFNSYLNWNYEGMIGSHTYYFNAGVRGQSWMVSNNGVSGNNQFTFSPRAQFILKPNWDKEMVFRFSVGFYN